MEAKAEWVTGSCSAGGSFCRCQCLHTAVSVRASRPFTLNIGRYTYSKDLIVKYCGNCQQKVREAVLDPIDHDNCYKQSCVWMQAEVKTVQLVLDLLREIHATWPSTKACSFEWQNPLNGKTPSAPGSGVPQAQEGNYDNSLRGLAKNCPSGTVEEMLTYGSFADGVLKISERKLIDFPTHVLSATEFVLGLPGRDKGQNGAEPDAALSEADELRQKMRSIARAKCAKLFQLMTPSEGARSSKDLAELLGNAVAAKSELKKLETGAVFINGKMWTETKTRGYCKFPGSPGNNLEAESASFREPRDCSENTAEVDRQAFRCSPGRQVPTGPTILGQQLGCCVTMRILQMSFVFGQGV